MAKSDGLSGRVALVTGGSRGIGRAACLELAAAGAAIAVNYRSRSDAAQEVVDQIVEDGGRALGVAADVGNRAAAEAMCERVRNELGSLDILVNSAGVLYSGSLLDYDDDQFDQMWQTNVKGVLHCAAAAAPGMMEQGWGRIINVASNAGVGTALPGTTLYAATKGAVLTLTRRMAFELGGDNVTVNAVLPGFIRTDMTMAGRTEGEFDSIADNLNARSVLGRGVGEPGDIATVIAFLASPESGFMTGQLLLADGGRTDYLSHV